MRNMPDLTTLLSASVTLLVTIGPFEAAPIWHIGGILAVLLVCLALTWASLKSAETLIRLLGSPAAT